MTRRSFRPGFWRGCNWSAKAVVLGLSLLFAGAFPAGAQQIELKVVGGVGAPGTDVNVTLTMSGDSAGAAVGAGLDVLFPLTADGLTVVPAEDCALAPRLETTHLLQARLGTSAPGSQRLILDVGTRIPDINSLGNGDLATCAFHISANAPLGIIPLTVAPGSVLVSDADAQTLPATGVGGEVTVALVTPTFTPTITPTPTLTPIPPTSTPTGTRTNTPTNTVPPPTNTPTSPPPTNTPTRTNTVPPTATRTGGAPVPSGDGGGCSIAAPGTAGASPLSWLMVPAVVLWWRRRRG